MNFASTCSSNWWREIRRDNITSEMNMESPSTNLRNRWKHFSMNFARLQPVPQPVHQHLVRLRLRLPLRQRLQLPIRQLIRLPIQPLIQLWSQLRIQQAIQPTVPRLRRRVVRQMIPLRFRHPNRRSDQRFWQRNGVVVTNWHTSGHYKKRLVQIEALVRFW